MTDLEIHQQLQNALDHFKDPETARPLSKTGQVTDWVIADGYGKCTLRLTSFIRPIETEVVERLKAFLQSQVPGLKSIEVRVDGFERPAQPLGTIGLTAKAVIAVAAGKGGVGKSTLATAMALSLEKLGAKVGLMDADIYGPSVPHILGLEGRPQIADSKIQPILSGTMPVMSMGFLIDRDQAVAWRGPMLNGSITQFLRDTAWGDLDYLIIDMPPGTGDVAITLSQLIPLTGAVIVCTPQEVALLDAGKAISMFEKTKIPILGVVENMSGFTDPESGKTFDIFGRGGARQKADQIAAPFLGEVPIQMSVRSESDQGRLADALKDPRVSRPFEDVSRALVRAITARIAADPLAKISLPVLG